MPQSLSEKRKDVFTYRYWKGVGKGVKEQNTIT
jgi:hypothetical protein